MPALNNPSDPNSDEYGKNLLLSELVNFWLREKIAPDGLVVALTKSSVPYEAGFRIYRVDSSLGLTTEYDSDVRSAVTTAFPGCSPIRVAVPKGTRDIVTLTGAGSDRISVHRYGTDRTLSLIQDKNGYGAPSFISFNSNGTDAYITNTSASPNVVSRLIRDSVSGSFTVNNGTNYPFAIGCSPVSLRTSSQDDIVFAVTSSGTPIGIHSFKNTGGNSGIFASGSPFAIADNPSQHNNLCLSEANKLIYMTSTNPTNPIYGYRYDSNGIMSLLPSSPFSPDSGYSNGASSTDNFSTSMAIDPDGKYLAHLYQVSGTYFIRLLSIDVTSGNLTQTDQKLSVGNAPKMMEWDGSGRFIYLVSDTGGTTNNYQLEYFNFTTDGKLIRGVNSPIIVSPMTNGYSPRHVKAIQRYYQ
ncbi:hypothetical protein EHQ42_17320 [Leptospira levettii]|uniref:hypothetical protein n=1 Tax=Leptospira levettii TaxID=2023178 RepID=UPI001083341E|nr:hypothetical protein [Leptospira levettii]TGL10002.1 hypothetical protein EHQ42_17320 [Leptospira levettii]